MKAVATRRHKRRQSRRPRRRLQTRRRGGAIIGEGRTSYVFRPPLACQGEIDNKFKSDLYVSKLTSTDIAEKELNVAKQLKEIDPDCKYTIYPVASCPLSELQTNANYNPSKHKVQFGRKLDTLLFSLNGGVPLSNLIEYIYMNTSTPEMLPPAEYINPIWKSLVELSTFIPTLYENGIVHGDITGENLVYNEDADDIRMRMIDFEFASYSNEPFVDMYYYMKTCVDVYDAFASYCTPSEPFDCPATIKTKAQFTPEIYRSCCEKMKSIKFSSPQ